MTNISTRVNGNIILLEYLMLNNEYIIFLFIQENDQLQFEMDESSVLHVLKELKEIDAKLESCS